MQANAPDRRKYLGIPGYTQFSNASEVIAVLEPMIIDLEAKLSACETNM